MKTVLLLCITLLALSFVPSQEQSVYVCANGTTEVYHLSTNCGALQRCSHEHVKMTRAEARADGLRVCGLED